jgi:hypothetical protein
MFMMCKIAFMFTLQVTILKLLIVSSWKMNAYQWHKIINFFTIYIFL